MTISLEANQNGAAVAALKPLVEILQIALDEAGIVLQKKPPRSTQEFSLWYLAAAQSLEAVVAREDRHPPMTAREVDLLCRCALTASNLGEAVALCIDFCAALAPRGGQLNLSVSDSQALFTMDSLRTRPSIASNIVDVTGLYSYYQLFRWLIGREISLASVGIGLGQRENSLPFLKLFNAPMLAGGRICSLEFSAALLKQPIIRQCSEFPDFMARFPCDVLGLTPNSLTQQIQALVSAAIYQRLPVPTMEQLSATLQIPESTLRRRLTKAGTSFREIKTSSLFEAAQYYLLRGSYTMEQIAQRLGFGDDTGFRRAFKTWAGVSPSAWREMNLPR